MIRKIVLIWMIVIFFTVTGCTKTSTSTQQIPSPVGTADTPRPASTPASTFTIPPPPPTSSPTPVLINRIWSPLIGIGLDELRLVTSWTFDEPSPLTEVGHPAIDFSFYQYRDLTTFERFPIQAVLPGRVIQITDNLYPYGNMLIIETPLSQLTSDLLAQIPIPTPLPKSSVSVEAHCPVEGTPVTWSDNSESIYLLYAHMSDLPLPALGDFVQGGQPLGFAGKTGNAAEPHLHLEMRIGPSNAAFGTISTYSSAATPAERYNYCIWSLSGVFLAVDPAKILYP